jgi:probable HAF family extracellular repeat protein
MKAGIFTHIALVTLFAALVGSLPAAGQDGNNLSSAHRKVHYIVKDLGTLGGTGSVAEGINDRGWVIGDANLAGNTAVHATVWRDGVVTDLGTLGGVNSQEQWPVKDNRGLIVGAAETSVMDPFSEDFCGFDSDAGVPPTGLICSGFLWRDGEMTALPTLGFNAQAWGVNNQGQAVGMAEQSTQLQHCASPQILDIQAVVWGPEPAEIHTLSPLPGDASAWAIGINDHGQVIGVSGDCVSPNFIGNGGITPLHAVLWQHGTATDLKTLGGSWAFPWAINSRGQVAGQSVTANDATTDAFLWQDGIMTDLGVVPGDIGSFAFGLNDRGQVVGASVSQTSARAFLWQNGVMIDLNSLVLAPPGSTPLYLVFGNDINSRGEIAAYAYDQSNGELIAALAIPCDEQHADLEGCAETTATVAQTTVTVTVAPATSGNPEVTLPETVREQLRRRLGLARFGSGLLRLQQPN